MIPTLTTVRLAMPLPASTLAPPTIPGTAALALLILKPPLAEAAFHLTRLGAMAIHTPKLGTALAGLLLYRRILGRIVAGIRVTAVTPGTAALALPILKPPAVLQNRLIQSGTW